jgi:hypothetical protein
VLAGETPVLVHNVNNWECPTSGEGWDHVSTYHRPEGKGVDDNKGIFTGTDDEVKSLLEETVRRGPGRRNTDDPVTGERRDGTKHEWDFGGGRKIGTNSRRNGGGEATGVRAILN